MFSLRYREKDRAFGDGISGHRDCFVFGKEAQAANVCILAFNRRLLAYPYPAGSEFWQSDRKPNAVAKSLPKLVP